MTDRHPANHHTGAPQQQPPATPIPILQAARRTQTGETHSQRGRPNQSQRGRSRGGPTRTHRGSSSNTAAAAGSSSGGMMRSFVEGFVSPFVHCWQPPLNGYGCGDMNMNIVTSACIADNNDTMVCGGGGVSSSRTAATTKGHTPVAMAHTTSTMVTTPTASSVAPANHRSLFPRTTPAPPLPVTPSVVIVHRDVDDYDDGDNQNQQQQIPRPTDVLCGRGGSSNRHNVHFRELVAANKAVYKTLTKKQKMLLSRQVVRTIHQAGGRFLAKETTNGQPGQPQVSTDTTNGGQPWQDIGLPRSLEKASQALREKSSGKNANNDTATTTTTTTPTILTNGAGDTEVMEDSCNANSSSQQQQQAKIHPRHVVAPNLVIPLHLEAIYSPKNTPSVKRGAVPTRSALSQQDSTISSSSHHPGWVADFPPTEQQRQPWVADFSSLVPNSTTPYSPDYHPYHHPSHHQQQQQPRYSMDSMPAPHRGAHPFSARQTSRLSRRQSSGISTTGSNNHSHITSHTNSSSSVRPHTITSTMVSPATPAYHHHHQRPAAMSWQQQQFVSPSSPIPNYNAAAHLNNDRHPASPDPSYSHNRTTANNHHLHPQPTNRGGMSPEIKRQRKNIADNNINDNNNHTGENDDSRDEEEDVILFDEQPANGNGGSGSKPFSLQDTSLTDGSQQLPAEIESKLSLKDKVISPSGLLQVRSPQRSRRNTTNHSHSSAASKERLNTSAEEEGLAGLVALSSATFLRLDES